VNLDIAAPVYHSHARFIHGDIRNPDDVRKAINGVDTLIHLAAMHHDFGISDDAYFSTNVDGAKVLVNEAVKQGVERIINFSSVAVYGNAGNPGPTTENTPPKPENAYGKSKLEAEEIFRLWAAADSQRKLVTLRSTVVFGPWNLANVLNLIKVIDKGWYVHIGNGSNIKSLAYVGNIIDAALFALEHAQDNQCLINYADQPHMSSRQIAEMQAALLGRKLKLNIPLFAGLLLAKPFDLMIALTGKNIAVSSKRVKKLQTQTYHSADKIRQMGFIPKVSIPDGMEEMIRWYRGGMKKD
jgi:GlcNAc-P-P-Und epimerase